MLRFIAIGLGVVVLLGAVWVAVTSITVEEGSGPVGIEGPRRPQMSTLTMDGTYMVGDCPDCDIPSGRWESVGAERGVCTWSRRTTMLIGAGHVIEQGQSRVGEPAHARLRDREYFSSAGCKPWTFVGE